MSFDPLVPAVLSPLTATIPLELARVLPALVDAHRVLAEFKGLSSQLPRPRLYHELLLVREAVDSCRIENIVTTEDAIYRALDAPAGTVLPPAEKEVIGYYVSIERALKALPVAGITVELLLQIQAAIVSDPKRQGLRTDEHRVRIKTQPSGMTLYTPPVASEVPPLLENLVQFLNQTDDLDPLLKLAIGHYQLESIHPFPDGNGRTGRVLNHLVLHHHQLVGEVAPYLSQPIPARRSEYYSHLQRMHERPEDGYTAWCQYIFETVATASRQATAEVLLLQDQLKQFELGARKSLGARYRQGLTELLFARPYVRTETVQRVFNVDRDTAADALRKLASDNLLVRIQVGRNVLYVNPNLADADQLKASLPAKKGSAQGL